MANVDRPRGFRPAKALLGSDWNSLVRKYTADAAKANPIGVGDPVKLEADGNVELAESGATILGVAVAFGIGQTNFGEPGYFNADDLGKQFMAATDAGIVGVVPAEAVLFDIQSSTAQDLAVGALNDFTNTTVNTTTGQSTRELVAGANDDVKVVEQIDAPDNDPALIHARYLVKFQTTTNTL